MSFTGKPPSPFCPECKAVRKLVTRRIKGCADSSEFVCVSAECKERRKKRRAELKANRERAAKEAMAHATSGFYSSRLGGPECPSGSPAEPCWGEVECEDWTDEGDEVFRCRGHRDCIYSGGKYEAKT